MPSFAFSSRFREGQWRAFRKFMLEERRDASDRFMSLDRQRQKIGDITIYWKVDEDGYASEQRIGLEVGPPGSSLEKLLSAYVALGGNPFDISMFLSPLEEGGLTPSDDGETVTASDTYTQPGRGILSPNDIKYAFDQGSSDGDMNMLKFQPGRRMGGAGLKNLEKAVGVQILHSRKWISKEMRFKRWRLEEQIIKLMDAREQLDEEAQDLLWATYGDMTNTDNAYDSEEFNDSLTAGYIAYFFDSTFRYPQENTDRGVTVQPDNSAEAGAAGSLNEVAIASYPNLMSDEDDEFGSTI